MGARKQSHRGMAIGISGGVGLTIPLVAYVATMPLDAANDMVRVSGLPFAAGALAGAGICALAMHVYDSSDDADARDVEDASRDAANAASDDSKEREKAFDKKHVDDGAKEDLGRTGFFGRHSQAQDVPVIARAVDAMSEEEAWAEIDSAVDAASPVSCDPQCSKDIYQIALEELSRAAARPADGTSASQDASGVDASAAQHVSMSNTIGAEATIAMPADDFDLDEPSGVFSAPVAPAAEAAQPRPAAEVSLSANADEAMGESAPVVEVPVADYSGREAMWAAALAVLAEDEEPAYRPAHAKRVDAKREQAVAEGRRATRMHSRVNEILGEEFDRVASQSVRHTSHEYLRVIEGGTMSMPAVKVEA